MSEVELVNRHQAAVAIFMELAGQERPSAPTIPGAEIRELRAKLILEEALETICGLGFSVWVNPDDANDPLSIESVEFIKKNAGPDLVEIADGCADMIVIATGTALACGINLEPIQKLVDDSNLAKFSGGRRREDGKWIKPADWQPPAIREELIRQGMPQG